MINWLKRNATLALLLFVSILAVGVGFSALGKVIDRAEAERKQAQVETISENPYLLTTKHDGHLFVVLKGSPVKAFLHHPDCSCGKSR